MSIGQDGALFEEWLELRNGCLCCSVKDNGVQAIENLMAKSGAFDYILLETTGLADPIPIAGMFWLDDELGSQITLDGIVTMIDAKNCLRQVRCTNATTAEENVSKKSQTPTALRRRLSRSRDALGPFNGQLKELRPRSGSGTRVRTKGAGRTRR